MCPCAGANFMYAVTEGFKVSLDGFFEGRCGFFGGLGAEGFPEEGVVPVATCVVAEEGGVVDDVLEEVFEALRKIL